MITKKQQGGQQLTPEQQELQFAIIGYYTNSKTQPKDENEINQVALALMQLKKENPEQYAQFVQLGQQAQSQTQSQKEGGVLKNKLNYIKALRNNCSEDEELVYFKKGGKMCPVCKKKVKKADEGTELTESLQRKQQRRYPTAPKVEDAYPSTSRATADSSEVLGRKRDVIAVRAPRNGDYTARIIKQIIMTKPNGNVDTTYVETPPYIENLTPRVINRTASSSKPEQKSEYEILKRRFNQALGIAEKHY